MVLAESSRRNAEVLAAMGMAGQLGMIWREANAKYMASHQRAADALAPPPPEPPARHLSDAFKGFFDPPRVRTNVPQIPKQRSR